jgi:hypothetical protein
LSVRDPAEQAGAAARARPGTSLAAPRLAALFLLGVLLFNFPLLAVFNVSASFLGIPVLYAYLFAAWAFLILLAYLIVRRKD